jgi:membrane protease YdiL (CAAX protease family)
MKHSTFIKFLVQFIFLVRVANFIWPTLAMEESVAWMLPIAISVTYIAIGIFFLLNENLHQEYNIDTLTLILFVLVGTVLKIHAPESTIIEIALRGLEWLTAGILFIRIITKKISLSRVKWLDLKWMIVGAIAGTLVSLFIAYLYISLFGFSIPPQDTSPYALFLTFLALLLMHCKGVVLEEIIFRGLLFGYLKKETTNEKQALFIQFMLFWAFHFEYIWSTPFSFWVSVPISAFVFSLIYWYSRSLPSSIAVHLFTNIFMTIFFVLLAN